MKGSEKQINWAESIISETMESVKANMDKLIEANEKRPNEIKARKISQCEFILSLNWNDVDAGKIIDSRDQLVMIANGRMGMAPTFLPIWGVATTELVNGVNWA